MRRFLLNVFFALIIGVLTIVLSLIAIIMMRQNEVKNVFTVPKGTTVLCLGNSHTGCTWEEGEGVYAIWSNGSAFVFSLMRLKELLRRNQLDGIKYCIIDADYEGLCGRMKPSCVEKTYLESLLFSWRYLNVLPEGKFQNMFSALTWQGHRRSLKSSLPAGNNLYINLPRTDQYNLIQKVEKAVDSDIKYHNDILALNKNILREIHELCKMRNIKLVLFAAPLVKEHPLRGAMRNVLDKWKSFLNHEGVEYWDLRDELSDDFFYDVDHLSAVGRKNISEKYIKGLINEKN